MKRPITKAAALLALGALAGCANVTTSNHARHQQTLNLSTEVTADAVDAMVKVFPPALTPLLVKQVNSDTLGQGLLDGLRERGYAVTELSDSRNTPSTGASFNYRMTPITDTGMYELVLTIGDARLSRVYVFDTTENRLYPGGDWSRKE